MNAKKAPMFKVGERFKMQDFLVMHEYEIVRVFPTSVEYKRVGYTGGEFMNSDVLAFKIGRVAS